MRLRSKLLLVFITVAILPLVLMALHTRNQVRSLGHELTEVSRQRLEREARTDFGDSLQQFTQTLAARRQIVEALLTMQAREIEQALRAAPPTDKSVFTDADFDRANPAIQDLGPSTDHADAEGRPIPISQAHAAVRFPAGASDSLRTQAAAMASTSAALQSIRSHAPDLLYWQYVTLENGLHLSYPGHGGYPPGYDPRTRDWYRVTMRLSRRVLMPPLVDATTRRITLSMSQPLQDGSGRPIGVTGIDVPLSALLSDGSLTHKWGAQARTNIISVPEQDAAPLIIASQEYGDFAASWQRRVTLDRLTCDDPAQVQTLLAQLRDGRTSGMVVRENGRQVIWAAAPVREAHLAALIRVPYDAVIAPAEAMERQFLDLTRTHTQTIAAAVGTLLIVLLGVVVTAAHSLSARIRGLSAAAQQVAAGNLQTRVPQRGSDEIAELAGAFNTMIPQLKSRLEMQNSLNIAMQVQQSLLPASAPKVQGLDIAGCSLYCDETGGDYYDFLCVERLGPQRIVIAIGDVTGHGVAAAMLMATARGLLRGRIEQPGNLAAVFTDMNRHMINERSPDRFMTLLCLLVDTAERTLSWVSAGHDPALAYVPEENRFYELAGDDVPLGIEERWQYSLKSQRGWCAGTVLVAGTDGIWEARNTSGEFFGKDRLMDIVRQHAAQPAEQIAQRITAAVAEFRGMAPQSDDVTLVVLRLLA